MEQPKYTFVRKDAGMIEQWWKDRINHLLLKRQLQDADALYREFDIADDNKQQGSHDVASDGLKVPYPCQGQGLITKDCTL